MFPLGRESKDRSTCFFRFVLLFVTSFKADKETTCKHLVPDPGRGNYASAGGISQSLWGKRLAPKPFSLPHLSATPATPPVASSLRALLPSQAEHAASAMRLWSQPRSSASTDSLKRSEQITPLSPAPLPQRGGHGVKFKEAESGFMKRADYTP